MTGEKHTERQFEGPDGTRFAYVDEGSGSPILLIHGWSGSLRWYDRNIAALARNHRVVAFDFRGHGSSEKTESGHTMSRAALASKISLVHLHRRPLQLQILTEKRTDLAEHAPGGFVGDASFALDLLCGDSAAG